VRVPWQQAGTSANRGFSILTSGVGITFNTECQYWEQPPAICDNSGAEKNGTRLRFSLSRLKGYKSQRLHMVCDHSPQIHRDSARLCWFRGLPTGCWRWEKATRELLPFPLAIHFGIQHMRKRASRIDKSATTRGMQGDRRILARVVIKDTVTRLNQY
jgi:hypothetical protein